MIWRGSKDKYQNNSAKVLQFPRFPKMPLFLSDKSHPKNIRYHHVQGKSILDKDNMHLSPFKECALCLRNFLAANFLLERNDNCNRLRKIWHCRLYSFWKGTVIALPSISLEMLFCSREYSF